MGRIRVHRNNEKDPHHVRRRKAGRSLRPVLRARVAPAPLTSQATRKGIRPMSKKTKRKTAKRRPLRFFLSFSVLELDLINYAVLIGLTDGVRPLGLSKRQERLLIDTANR